MWLRAGPFSWSLSLIPTRYWREVSAGIFCPKGTLQDKPGVSFPVTLFPGSTGMAFSKDPHTHCGCTAKALLL